MSMTSEKPDEGSTRFKSKSETPAKPVVRREPGRFDIEARRIIRAEMQRRDVSYKDLVKSMNKRAEPGEKVSERGLVSRINRGTFSLGFAIQVLRAMGVNKLPIGEPE